MGQDEAVKIGWKDSASWIGHDGIKSFDEITVYFCCESRSAWPRDATFIGQMFDGLSMFVSAEAVKSKLLAPRLASKTWIHQTALKHPACQVCHQFLNCIMAIACHAIALQWPLPGPELPRGSHGSFIGTQSLGSRRVL